MAAKAPEGYNTINPFMITKDALKAIDFLKEVFGANEVPEARTLDTDGLLLHSELKLGDSTLMVADTKPGWPFTPSLLQIYVDDVVATLARAKSLGARVVTRPTDVFGDRFSRFVDPWDNLWWVYEHQGEMSWDDQAGAAGETAWATEAPELQYIHATLLETMAGLGREQA